MAVKRLYGKTGNGRIVKLVKKVLLIGGVSLAALLVIGVLLYPAVLAPRVDGYLHSLLQRALTEQFQREVAVGEVHLTFPDPQLTVSHLEIARFQSLSEGTLLSANALNVRISLKSLFAKEIVIKEILLDTPSVWIEFDQQGQSNLPDFSSGKPKPEPKKPSRLNIAEFIQRLTFPRIALKNANIHLVHQPSALRIDVDRLSTDIAFELHDMNAHGSIALEGGRFDWQERGPIATALSGNLAFANNTLTLSQVELQADSTRVTVDGTLENLLTRPHLNVTVNTSVALDELDRFLQLHQNLSGIVTVAGSVTGPIADITAEAHVSCPEGTAWELDFARVDTDVQYHQNLLQLDNLSVDILGGHAGGSGVLTFAPAFGYQTALTVAQLDVAEANRFTGEVSLPVSGRMSGTIDVRSETVAFEDLILETALTLADVNAYGVEVPQGALRVDIIDTTLYIKDLLATVFQGTASGDLQMDLTAEPHYQADFDLRDIELADIMTLIPQPTDVSGRVSGKFRANGATYELNDVTLQADLGIHDLAAYGITSDQTEARVRIQDSALWIEKLSTDIFDGRLDAEGQLVLAGDALPKFALQATLDDIASGTMLTQLAGQSADQTALFDGRISGDVNVRGDDFTLDAINGYVNLTGAGSAVSQEGAVPFAMQVKTALADQIMTLEDVTVNSEALQLGVSGTVDVASLTLDISYDVASKEIAALLNQVLVFLPSLRENSPLAQFSGTIDSLRGTVQGSAVMPKVRTEAHFTNADLVWAQVDDVRADLLYDGESLQIDRIDARYKNAAITVADGRILLDDPAGISLDVPVTIAAAPIKEYLALAKQVLPIEGDLHTITTTIRGPVTNVYTEVALNIRKGAAWGQSFDSLTGTVALAGNRLVLENLALKKNGGTIRVDGFMGFDTSFDATVQATDLNFHDVNATKDVGGIHYEGQVDIDLKASGTFANPTGNASIRLKKLVYQDTPIEDVTCEVTMGNQTIQATLVTFRQKLVTTFELGLQNLEYQVELLMDDAAIEQILSIASNVEGITGIISGRIASEGSFNDMKAVSATVKLSRLDLDILGQKVSNAREIDLLITPERFVVNSLDMRGDELGLFAEGNLDFSGNFDLAVDGAMDLRPFAGLLPSSAGISGLAGRVQLMCNVRGTFLDPKIEGIAELHHGNLQLRAYPDPIKNIEAKIAFAPGQVKILEIQGEVGGGSFNTTGTIAYAGTGLQDFKIDVSAKQIAVDQAVDALALTVSAPQLQLSGTLAQPKIAGEIFIHNALYSKDLDIQGIISNKSRKISLNTTEQSTPLAFDLFIRAPKDILVRNRFAEIDVRADLRIQGSTAAPQLEGRVEILAGNVQFGDITYRVLSGVLDFADPLRLNPEMNIRVETTVQEYTVSLGISGPLSEFILDMQADPELSQAQITRLLAGGSSSGGSGYEFVTKPLQTLVEGELGKAMRLDRFSVDVDPLLAGTEGAEASPSVTLGKRLFGDLLLTFTTSVGGSESSQLVELEYRLSDRLSLTASRNEKGEIDTSFTFKVTLDDK